MNLLKILRDLPAPGRRALLAGVLAVMVAGTAFAQDVTLTPEQQRMLDQLPAAQRDAAMRQLESLQSTQSAGQQDSGGQAPLVVNVPPAEPTEPEEATVLRPGDTVVLSLQPRPATAGGRSAEDVAGLIRRLLSGNPFTLDSMGRLELEGVEKVPLAGLNEDQATFRLNATPGLAGVSVRVTLLPLAPVGADALRPFGYELFRRGAGALGPNDAMPVPADFVIGVGDTIRVQLFGNQNADYELPVGRNGTIRFPEIGPLSVVGLTYSDMQELIRQRVQNQYIGTQVSVTMGELRSVQIFVMGDVVAPGSYTVNPMSTIMTALARSRGVAERGTMRRVQLKRNGQIVQTLDVYDLLLRGDTRADVRLRAGDVVFVPPVGTRVSVSGEVNRPAIYEYKGAANVEDVIGLAGGMKSTAYRRGVKLERFEPGSGLRIVAADMATESGRKLKVSDGDVVVVPAGVAQLEDSIVLAGNLQRPGEYQWFDGIRISDLIRSSRDLQENSDLNYLLIRRETVANAALEVLSADIEAAWQQKGGQADVLLKPRDTVYVFDLEVGRRHIVDPLVAELQLRTSVQQPLAVASVGGQVNASGQYPIEPGMRVSDLIRAAGGLAESAYIGEAEVTRYEIIDGEERQTDLIRIDLSRALDGDPSADLVIQPSDFLNVKEVPRWRNQRFVEIGGEVRFPGRYAIEHGETLSSVVSRAGGLTDLAFPQGSVFTRDELRQREREQLEVLARRIEGDLAAMAASDPSQAEAVTIGQDLLAQIRNTEPVGRLVIDLPNIVAGKREDIVLRDGDVLLVPPVAQEVTVIGEVQYGTSHIFDPVLSRDDYIGRSGGTTRKADDKNIYVVRAGGDVVVASRSRFFSTSNSVEIRPGDTIVVPLNVDRVNPITLWTSATQILYNLAIAVAAVNSFQ